VTAVPILLYGIKTWAKKNKIFGMYSWKNKGLTYYVKRYTYSE